MRQMKSFADFAEDKETYTFVYASVAVDIVLLVVVLAYYIFKNGDNERLIHQVIIAVLACVILIMTALLVMFVVYGRFADKLRSMSSYESDQQKKFIENPQQFDGIIAALNDVMADMPDVYANPTSEAFAQINAKIDLLNEELTQVPTLKDPGRELSLVMTVIGVALLLFVFISATMYFVEEGAVAASLVVRLLFAAIFSIVVSYGIVEGMSVLGTDRPIVVPVAPHRPGAPERELQDGITTVYNILGRVANAFGVNSYVRIDPTLPTAGDRPFLAASGVLLGASCATFAAWLVALWKLDDEGREAATIVGLYLAFVIAVPTAGTFAAFTQRA